MDDLLALGFAMDFSVMNTAVDLTRDDETADISGLQSETEMSSAGPPPDNLNTESGGLNKLFAVLDRDQSGYSPSIQTDFSGFLPTVSASDNAHLMVRSAWKSLSSESPKLPWEGNFWEDFLNPNVSALDMVERSFKRPLPAPVSDEQVGSSTVEVDHRVVHKPFKEIKGFLQHVRDVPERNWREGSTVGDGHQKVGGHTGHLEDW